MLRRHREHQGEDWDSFGRGSVVEQDQETHRIPDVRDGRALTTANLLSLQRFAGNRAVSALALRAKSDLAHVQRQDGEEPTPFAVSEEEPAEASEEMPAGGVLAPIDGEPLAKVNCDSEKPDGRGASVGGQLIGGPADASAATSPLPVHVDLGFGGVTERTDDEQSSPRKGDSVGASVTMGSAVTRSGSVSPFGAEFATYTVDNISWSKSGTKVDINARFLVSCRWNTNSGGKTDVSSANAAVVTAANQVAIADDLKPDGTGRPTRSSYWCADLTERHEQFHAQDDIARAQLYLPTAKAWLESQTVAATDAGVRGLLGTARGNLEADGWAWYNGSPGGESRAYADGKAGYQARSDAVRARTFPAPP